MNNKNYQIFEDETLNNTVIELNNQILNKNVLFSTVNPSPEQIEERLDFINDFFKQYNDHNKKEVKHRSLFHMLDIEYENTKYTLLINNISENAPQYNMLSKAYTRFIKKDISIELIKDENNSLRLIDFKINGSSINTIRYSPNGYTLNNKDIYEPHEKEKIKEIQQLTSDIYQLINDLQKLNSTHFLDVFVKSLLTGQDELEKEKDLLHIGYDINLDNYNYQKAFVDLNKKAKNITNFKNN